MNFEFVVDRKGMQKNIRIELFNVKSVNGGIQIKIARKVQNWLKLVTMDTVLVRTTLLD